MNKFIEQTRYIALIAVFFLLATSLFTFGWGALKALTAISTIVVSMGKDEAIAVSLIEEVDVFLIAIALYVFAVSIYELFIADLNLPDWMIAHNLFELKAKLSGVIVLVMAVKFLEKLLGPKDTGDVLQIALSITLVSLALIALSYLGKKD